MENVDIEALFAATIEMMKKKTPKERLKVLVDYGVFEGVTDPSQLSDRVLQKVALIISD